MVDIKAYCYFCEKERKVTKKLYARVCKKCSSTIDECESKNYYLKQIMKKDLGL